jgi:hypothetical protein
MPDMMPPVEDETAEQTALRLLVLVLNETYVEGTKKTQKDVLDAYATCLEAVKGQRAKAT